MRPALSSHAGLLLVVVHHNEGREDITKTFRTFRYACDPFIRIMLEFCIMLDIRLSSCW